MIIRLTVSILFCCLLTTPAFAAPKSSTDKIVDTFMDLDTNASGSVSYGEYKAMVDRRARTRFRKMDANRDGAVTDAEYRAFWRQEKAKWYRLNR